MKYNKPETGMSDAKLFWLQNIYQQINRILASYSEGADWDNRLERIMMTMDAFEGLLHPHKDPAYLKRMKKMEKDCRDVLNEMEETRIGVSVDMMRNMDYIRTKYKFNELMMLIKRNSLLPDLERGASEAEGVKDEKA